MKFTSEEKYYLCQNHSSIYLLQDKVIKKVLFTISKAVRDVKINYIDIFSVHMIQQCGKLAWH